MLRLDIAVDKSVAVARSHRPPASWSKALSPMACAIHFACVVIVEEAFISSPLLSVESLSRPIFKF